MRRALSIFLLVGCTLLGGVHHLNAQAVVEGRIIDAESKKPLKGAHVFFSGTKIGTSTDPSGRYELHRIPPGAHRLVVSMVGYGRKAHEVVLAPEETKTMDFALQPVVYEMQEVFVGDLDKKWRKQLDRFEDLFLGESRLADSVEILNPEVLRFDSNFWGRLTAEALAPLQIENRALGYHITYYLEEFEHTGTRTRWDGDPVFTELTSSDPMQQLRWEQNRREAFYGSMRHFLLSVLQGRLQDEGFLLYRRRSSNVPYDDGARFRLSADRLIDEREEDFLFDMKFYGRLEIVYTRAKEDPRYREWLRNLGRHAGGSQVSWLELNERPITVDADGEILEPYGATQMGYFAYQRIADLTPREYRPQEYTAPGEESNEMRP